MVEIFKDQTAPMSVHSLLKIINTSFSKSSYLISKLKINKGFHHMYKRGYWHRKEKKKKRKRKKEKKKKRKRKKSHNFFFLAFRFYGDKLTKELEKSEGFALMTKISIEISEVITNPNRNFAEIYPSADW